MAAEVFDIGPGGRQVDATAPPVPVVALEPERNRETAFALWAYRYGRNAAATAAALDLPPRTVQRWAAEDGWAARADREAAELVANVRAAAEVALFGAVADAIDALHKIARGQGETKTVLDKRGEPVTVEIPVPFQAASTPRTPSSPSPGASPRPPRPGPAPRRPRTTCPTSTA